MTDVGGVTSPFTQVLSDDAVYDYRADRWWAEGPRLAFVGCNPSLITWQAGARLDPTSANCEAIARRDGYAGVTMLNLWALRGTDPRELRGDPPPGHAAWIEGRFKLHAIPNDVGRRYALYDLERDPAETHDLAREEHERVARLAAALDAWQREALADALDGAAR